MILDVEATTTDSRIPRELLDLSTAEKARAALESAPYPAHCKAIIIAFAELMDERGWTQSEAAQKVKRGSTGKALSTTSLSQLLSGKYPTSPENLSKALDATITRERGRALFGGGGFAHTRLYDAMVELADIAVITQRIACLHGGRFSGKTTCGKFLSQTYKGAHVVFVTMPYADTYGGFVRRLAGLRGIALKGSLSDLREAIIKSFDSSYLLVVDEFHQPLVSYGARQSLRVMEFIREINNVARCAILLLGDTVGYETLCDAPHFHHLAAALQTIDVCDDHNDLRPLADADLVAIAGSFNLTLTGGQIKDLRDIAEEHNITRLFDLLRIASGNAEIEGRTLTWRDLEAPREMTLRLAA